MKLPLLAGLAASLILPTALVFTGGSAQAASGGIAGPACAASLGMLGASQQSGLAAPVTLENATRNCTGGKLATQTVAYTTITFKGHTVGVVVGVVGAKTVQNHAWDQAAYLLLNGHSAGAWTPEDTQQGSGAAKLKYGKQVYKGRIRIQVGQGGSTITFTADKAMAASGTGVGIRQRASVVVYTQTGPKNTAIGGNYHKARTLTNGYYGPVGKGAKLVGWAVEHPRTTSAKANLYWAKHAWLVPVR